MNPENENHRELAKPAQRQTVAAEKRLVVVDHSTDPAGRNRPTEVAPRRVVVEAAVEKVPARSKLMFAIFGAGLTVIVWLVAMVVMRTAPGPALQNASTPARAVEAGRVPAARLSPADEARIASIPPPPVAVAGAASATAPAASSSATSASPPPRARRSAHGSHHTLDLERNVP